MDLLKAENRRLQSQITSPTSHMPKYSGPPALVPSSSSPPTASSVGIRLGERLQGGVSSPSQRLLSRLYGDDYDREEDVTMVAVAGDQEGSSTGNSWEDSTCSEDDLLPGATPLVKDSQEILSERSKSNVKPLNKDRLMKFESSSSEEGSRNDVESPKPRKLWAQHENGCENGSEQDDMKGGGSVDAGRLRNLSSWSSAGEIKKPTGGNLNKASRIKSKSCSDVTQKTKLKSILKSFSKYDLSEELATANKSVACSITISDSSSCVVNNKKVISQNHLENKTTEVPKSSDPSTALVLLSPSKYRGPPPLVLPKPILGTGHLNKIPPRPTTSQGLPTVTSKIDTSMCARSPIIGGRAPHPPSQGHVIESHLVDGSLGTSSGRTGKRYIMQSAPVVEMCSKNSFPWKSNHKKY